jgi:hypothetical protein
MKRPVIIGIIIVVLIAGLASLLVARKKSPTVTVTPPSSRDVAPILLSPKYGTAPTGVTFSYAGPQVLLPTTLPSFQTSYDAGLLTNAAALAKQLGFTGQPNSPESYVYDWSGESSFFSYNDKSKAVSYGIYSSSPQSLTVQSTLLLLSTYHIVSPDVVLTETDRKTATDAEGGADKQQPITVITYQLRLKSQQYPLFFTGVTRTAGEIHTLPDGRVVSFSFFASPSFSASSPAPLVSIDAALTALNDGKGYLANVANAAAAGYAPDATPTFTKVVLSSVVPAFLYIPDAAKFVPIYVFEGTGTGGSGTQLVRYFLQAAK